MLNLSWLLPLAILLSHEMSALKKEKTVELGVQDTHLREKKIQSISFSSKSFKKQERYISPQKSKSRIRLSPLLSPSSPYTIHLPHMHILIWLMICFFGSMVWLCNKCLINMYTLSPTYEAPDIKSLIRVGWERRQCHYALYHKYYILWEKAYTITALVRIQKY